MYSDYQRGYLKQEPTIVDVGFSTVHHVSFCLPENEMRTPIVIIGGAFQNFSSFSKEVEALFEINPVIIVALPGQITNYQCTRGMSIDDLTLVLMGYMVSQKMERVSIVGISFGGLIAMKFGLNFPDQVEKLVLYGVTSNADGTLKSILLRFVQLVENDKTEELAEGITNNSIRILNAALDLGEKNIYCDTLIITGRYDNFVRPIESIKIYNHCKRAHIALFLSGDHLLYTRHSGKLISLYKQFFKGESFTSCDEVVYDKDAIEILEEKRLMPRYEAHSTEVKVSNDKQKSFQFSVLDINQEGCRFRLNRESPFIEEIIPNYMYKIEILGSDVELKGSIILDPDKRYGRVVFLKLYFEEMFKINMYIEDTIAGGK
jgi:pimeloyl-ACP methyl ester carboxylesterase